MKNRPLVRASGVVAGISGIIILFSTIYPIASYERESRQKYPRLVSPLVEKERKTPRLYEVDYTKASNWFVGVDNREDFSDSKVSHYTISIPKLKIENATVAIGGEDLSKSLIQYPGTSLPGKAGNSVIFGHSILPQFFDSKDYLAIFSTLPTLTKGDKITVSYDGVSYSYRVDSMFEVLPTDLQVLDQNESDSNLTLITCVPPGHPLKPRRLVVRASIIPPEVARGL